MRFGLMLGVFIVNPSTVWWNNTICTNDITVQRSEYLNKSVNQ